ncbi:MAG TPA: MTH1187 family thiamine-binding protein [Candidatus Bathyarchaeia archaeon]|nr:MTH1187 family thiamine-binding protein [Candidatus Bathyarchaeia archaeon]
MPRKRIVTIAEFSIHPIGEGTSVGRYVKAAIDSISQIRGLKYQVTPMATVLEAQDLKTILKAVEQGHRAVRSLGAKRISSTLRIDERLDKARTMSDKVRKVSG